MDDAEAANDNKKKRRRVNLKKSSLKPIPETEITIGVGDIEDFSPQETLEIRASLLKWYYENQRVLPWRKNQLEEEDVNGDDGDGQGREVRAYAVWVSEVMLQQTRVTAVIDYYNRWMEKWPTVHHLAQASQDEVNEMWAGLGYYRRARFLLEGAKLIVERGEFPKTASTLRSIRGIGDYTAGAIASIAFKEAVPVVDGNVIRVIARLKAVSANPKKCETVKSFWKLAGQLVDLCTPGDFNQALMELGATLCTPLSPSCSTCPVSGQCRALVISRTCESIKVTDYPVKVEKPKQRSDFSAVCVVEIAEGPETQEGAHSKNNKFLLVKRPEEGLLAGLWEFPSVILDGQADLATRRKAMDQYLKQSFKLDAKRNSCITLREDIGEYVHVFSHIRLRMYVELLVLNLKGGVNLLNRKEDKEKITWKLVDGKSIQSMGLTSGVRMVYNMIQKFKQSRMLTNSKTKRKRNQQKLIK
ncbi:adenine DNA glycosylase [Telopea speciosissima]|uniref:adenine DNA glycosylase n=1 Tax=Telopea speciosissima TaxID=54955 RepID=UPI001CC45C17|nr:adenine DNA glycosylase [Telopea speciosissima]XP_043696592.1 adenine DNA glycosylase [Telopea speciosissima]